MIKNKLKRLAVVAAIFALGFASGSEYRYWDMLGEHTVMTRYVVKPGDTFWTIAAHYCNLDQRNIYILEYQDELRALNPNLVRQRCQVFPGDVLKIRYYGEEKE